VGSDILVEQIQPSLDRQTFEINIVVRVSGWLRLWRIRLSPVASKSMATHCAALS